MSSYREGCRNINAEKHCPVCGRLFYITSLPDWGFAKNYTPMRKKTKRIYFCRYNCMRQWEKEHPKDLGREDE